MGRVETGDHSSPPRRATWEILILFSPLLLLAELMIPTKLHIHEQKRALRGSNGEWCGVTINVYKESGSTDYSGVPKADYERQ